MYVTLTHYAQEFEHVTTERSSECVSLVHICLGDFRDCLFKLHKAQRNSSHWISLICMCAVISILFCTLHSSLNIVALYNIKNYKSL